MTTQSPLSLNINHDSDNIWKELWSLNQDVVMTDTDNAHDNKLNNNDAKQTMMD